MISIIIPVYNAEKYLERCLQSIISQSYQDLEIILVNDGSLDNSLNICHSFSHKDKRVKVMTQTNSGVSSARNNGLSRAKGEYVMFVDSDDYMLPGMCEMMVNTLESKGADCVICGTTETWGGLWAPAEDVDYSDLASFKMDFVKHLRTELLSPPWNKIYKRAFITMDFDTSVSFGEDLMFNLNYFNNCNKISFVTKAPFYHEKANENSLVNRVYPSRLYEIETVHSAVLNFYDGMDPEVNQKYIRDLLVYFRAIVQNEHFSINEKKECFNEWAKNAHICFIDLSNISMEWKTRLLLFFIRHKMWGMAEIQINWRKLLKNPLR